MAKPFLIIFVVGSVTISLNTREKQCNFNKYVICLILHNCQKTQKVITFPRFLIEHPVFIMYMVYMHLKKKKNLKKKNVQFFVDPIGFVPTIFTLQAV